MADPGLSSKDNHSFMVACSLVHVRGNDVGVVFSAKGAWSDFGPRAIIYLLEFLDPSMKVETSMKLMTS